MPTVSAQTNLTLPHGHESSAQRSHRDSDDARSQWKRHNQLAKQVKSAMEAVEQQSRMMEKMRRRILGGSGAAAEIVGWQQPYKELDPTLVVPNGTFVYISPSNTIVTTGLTDAVSMATVKSVAGIWEAAQDVPAKTSTYNVPQLPYPDATGTPTGSAGNVKGDLDGANVFWIHHQEYSYCLNTP